MEVISSIDIIHKKLQYAPLYKSSADEELFKDGQSSSIMIKVRESVGEKCEKEKQNTSRDFVNVLRTILVVGLFVERAFLPLLRFNPHRL